MCRITIGIIRNEFETVKINRFLLAYLGKRIGFHINKITCQFGRRANKLIASATALPSSTGKNLTIIFKWRLS